MAKTEAPTFFSTLMSSKYTTRTQGRLVRQLTGLSIAAIVLVGTWSLRETLSGSGWQRQGIPAAVAVLGLWLAFRIVNHPPFVEFLAAVEAEMAKVNWPSWDYLVRAAGVVLATMLILTAALKLFDVVWLLLFKAIGFLQF